jgi:hypothetical protein
MHHANKLQGLYRAIATYVIGSMEAGHEAPSGSIRWWMMTSGARLKMLWGTDRTLEQQINFSDSLDIYEGKYNSCSKRTSPSLGLTKLWDSP